MERAYGLSIFFSLKVKPKRAISKISMPYTDQKTCCFHVNSNILKIDERKAVFTFLLDAIPTFKMSLQDVVRAILRNRKNFKGHSTGDIQVSSSSSYTDSYKFLLHFESLSSPILLYLNCLIFVSLNFVSQMRVLVKVFLKAPSIFNFL